MPDTSQSSQPVSAAVPSDAEWHVDKGLPRALARILALDDFEEPARRYLPRPMFGYVSGGAETNASAAREPRTVRRDRAQPPRAGGRFRAHREDDALRPRLRRALRHRPMGGTSMAAYRGDIVLARAAAQTRIPMIMSGASLTRLEEVRAAGGTAWFQPTCRANRADHALGRQSRARRIRYARPHRRRTGEREPREQREERLQPAAATTARLAWESALRPRWLFGMFRGHSSLTHAALREHGRAHPAHHPRLPRDGERDRLAWTHLELMRRLWKGRLVLKGVLAPEDARIAGESGVDGVIVSNHGGRQLGRRPGAPARAPRGGCAGGGHDGDDRRRNPPRHRRFEGARARRAVRLRRPALPLRGRDRREAACATG